MYGRFLAEGLRGQQDGVRQPGQCALALTPVAFRMTYTTFIALGSNLGDRRANLRAAVAALPPAVQVTACSPIYQTAPWGYTDQPDFLNQVVRGETNLSPRELLVFLKNLESSLGREKTFRYGPRQIDLDILFYADTIVAESDLQIPHPRLHERAFVLVPLADLAPDWVHPQLGCDVRTLLAGVDAREVERFAES